MFKLKFICRFQSFHFPEQVSCALGKWQLLALQTYKGLLGTQAATKEVQKNASKKTILTTITLSSTLDWYTAS